MGPAMKTASIAARTLKLVLKLLGACLLGVVITAFFMQQNPHTLAKLEQELHKGFGKAFDCVSSGKVTSINLLWPTIEMESVVVKPQDGSLAWHWSCRKAVITFSWLATLLHRSAPLHITLYDVRANSLADDTGHPAIATHIKKLGAPAPDGFHHGLRRQSARAPALLLRRFPAVGRPGGGNALN